MDIGGGHCCIKPEHFRIVSGFSESLIVGGTGIPWNPANDDNGTQGYFTALIYVCGPTGPDTVVVAWPPGSALGLDEGGNLIYTFGTTISNPATCVDFQTITFIPPGANPPQPPNPQPPQPPPPPAGGKTCPPGRCWRGHGAYTDPPFTTSSVTGAPIWKPYETIDLQNAHVSPHEECWIDCLLNEAGLTVPGVAIPFAMPVGWEVVYDPVRCFIGIAPVGTTGLDVVKIRDCVRWVAPQPPGPPGCPPPQPPLDQCKVPVEEKCPPGWGGLPPGKEPAKEPHSCQEWDEFITKIIEAGVNPENVLTFATTTGAEEGLVSDIIHAVTGRNSPIIATIMNGLGRALTKFGSEFNRINGCDPVKLTPITLFQAAAEFLEKWTGAIPDALMQRLRYTANIVCQYMMPTGSDADGAYLMGEIDKELWKCWHQLNGNQIEEAEKVMKSKRTKPNVHEIITLRVRDVIQEETARKLCKQLGVIDDADYERFKDLIQAFPNIDDVFRMMVRDVADPAIVEKFQLDKDFDKKWQGRLLKYAKGQGISDDLAKDIWRAHWQYPSNTQAFECLHKLRPGKKGLDPNVVTTQDDIKTLITANDMSPFWVERLMASSYHSLTRVDTRRAYEIGALDYEGMVSAYQDIGYNEAVANVLAEFTKKDIELKRRRSLGLPNAKQFFGMYVANEITTQEFVDGLTTLGYEATETETAITEAENAKSRSRRKKRIGLTKKGYLRGAFDQQTAQAKLTQLGLTGQQVAELIDDWNYQKGSETKLATLGQLCTWFSNHLLSADDYLSRLRNMGFDPADIGRIAAVCGITASEKERKAAEKARKEAERLAKEAAAKAAKRLKEGEDNIKKAAREFDEADLFTAKILDKIAAAGEAETAPAE